MINETEYFNVWKLDCITTFYYCWYWKL